jgi:hypothetical protein
MRLLLVTVAALCALAWAGAAQAGTVSVSGDDVTLAAAASEVTASWSPSRKIPSVGCESSTSARR